MNTWSKDYTEKRRVDFTKYATYPLATIVFPDLGKPIYKYKFTAEEPDIEENK